VSHLPNSHLGAAAEAQLGNAGGPVMARKY